MRQVENCSPRSPKVLEAVSVFLYPLKPHAEAIQRLEQRWRDSSPEEASKRSRDDIRLFHDDCWGEEVIAFGRGGALQATVRSHVAWVLDHDWVALALEAALRPKDTDGPDVLLDDLLAFNVGFRRMQGEERQDSFFGLEIEEFKLSDGRPSGVLYEAQAHTVIGRFQPLENLKKATLLSYAKFDRLLNDQELYRFGSVAYPQEPVTAEWSEHLVDHIFDRWKSAGWRCFVYSYSLVYALDAQCVGREDASIRRRFLTDYVKMGVAIAIQRAWLQEFPQRLRGANELKALRGCHEELIRMQSRFGMRWTSEGTQRMRIEELWRKASGVDDRLSEVTQLLDQKVDLLEAGATERLNTAVFLLQCILGFLAGAQIGVAIEPKWLYGPLCAFAGLLLCWLMPLLFTKLKGET